MKTLLAFFEHMGMDIRLHLADEEYLKSFFYALVIRYYERFRKYIEYWQNKRDSRGGYCNFVFLAQSWEKENDPPELPRICQRKSILKAEDLAYIDGQASTRDYGIEVTVLNVTDKG